jgi:transcription elongation factor Elf1
MSACPNCGTKLSCGCQKKRASNGVFVCRSCITRYEKSLQPAQETPKENTTQLKEWGKDRYKNLEKFIKK